MNSFILPLSDETLYSAHNLITFILFVVWIMICILGYKLNDNTHKKNITIFLIGISLFQEIFDYLNRFLFNDLYIVTIQKDLPLQLCHFAYWFAVACLICQLYNYKRKQFYFNCACFLGFSGALQSIITVDLTGIYTLGDILTLHLQHSFIIMNLLWLIFAYGLKFNQKGIVQAFLFTNLMVIVVGIINYFLGSNYMYLCVPPDANNPLLIGEWPYYILVLEMIFFIYGYIIYAPFLVIKYLNRNK